jgi:MFS family permease
MTIADRVEYSARSAARSILELDRSVPEATDEQIEAQVQRDYAWNFAVNLTDGATFWLGTSFLSYVTIVPLFISKLTDSMLPIAIAAMLGQSGWFLPQILTSNWVERLPRRKPVIVYMGLLAERIPAWFLVGAALLAFRWPGLALVLFLLAFSWKSIGGGLIATSWQDLIARVIPVERRGRFWGLTSAIGTGLAFAGAALATWVLATYPFPGSFVAIFSLAAVVLTAGWCFTTLIRERARPVPASRPSQREYLAGLPKVIRADPPFRRFLAARLLLGLGGMGLGFVTVAAIQRFDVADGTVGLFMGVQLLGQTVGNLLFGLLADRHGHKLSLEWAALVYVAAFVTAWLAPSAGWYFVVLFLIGLSQGILVVSGILVVLEFSGPERRPTYLGIANTSLGVVYVAGPLVGAWLAGIGFEWLFAASAAISGAAFVAMHWWVREPRWADAG